MFKISKVYSDVFVAVFVLCIALLLLVPLPTMLLDFLIAFNIGFSLLLLLIGLSLQNALSLLTFPTLLLLSTLFRLSLNVASTRLILSEGEAGDVIRSFGTFLISGKLAVGLIIFLIITVVNFIVIARGASRVSEVSARFVLDSLPGKQMAIDSELRMGTISAEEAKLKREELRKESQLFGSMDGAVKFVQGDAIAGIFITFVNIFGGMYLGIKNGLSFEDAVQTYTMLTVGDGLVTQIPALFISICAGIIVTRVSSGKDSTLGSDLFSQVLKNKKIIYFVSFAILIFGTLPGLPFLPFLLTSLLLIAAGYFIDLSPKSPTPWSVRQVSSENLQIGSSGNLKLDYAKESNFFYRRIYLINMVILKALCKIGKFCVINLKIFMDINYQNFLQNLTDLFCLMSIKSLIETMNSKKVELIAIVCLQVFQKNICPHWV